MDCKGTDRDMMLEQRVLSKYWRRASCVVSCWKHGLRIGFQEIGQLHKRMQADAQCTSVVQCAEPLKPVGLPKTVGIASF